MYITFDTPAEFFNIAPTPAGYAISSATISLGCADHATSDNRFLTKLTAAQAHLTTGSTAQVLLALADAIYTRYSAIPTADRPTKFTATLFPSLDAATGELIYNYSFSFRVSPGTIIATNS